MNTHLFFFLKGSWLNHNLEGFAKSPDNGSCLTAALEYRHSQAYDFAPLNNLKYRHLCFINLLYRSNTAIKDAPQKNKLISCSQSKDQPIVHRGKGSLQDFPDYYWERRATATHSITTGTKSAIRIC